MTKNQPTRNYHLRASRPLTQRPSSTELAKARRPARSAARHNTADMRKAQSTLHASDERNTADLRARQYQAPARRKISSAVGESPTYYELHETLPPGEAQDQPIANRRLHPSQLQPQKRQVNLSQSDVVPQSEADRHANLRNSRSEQSQPRRLVRRSFSVTGEMAPVGNRRGSETALHRLPKVKTPIPKRSSRGGFLGRLFGTFILLALISGGVAFALLSPVFQVKQVMVTGTHDAALIHVIQHMGVQGQNIFLLNQIALSARLEALPLVSAASMSLNLPNGITVAVQERVPVLAWQSGTQNNATVFGVAPDGMVIETLHNISNNLDLVVDTRQARIGLGAGTHIAKADIAFAQQIYAQMPALSQVGRFSLQYVDRIQEGANRFPANRAGYYSFVIVSENGWLAYLGDEHNRYALADRLLILQQILDLTQKQHQHLATIDLRFGLRPYYTLQA